MNKKNITILLASITLTLIVFVYIVYSAGTESVDVFDPVFKGDSKNYRFTVKNVYDNDVIDITSKTIKFRVKKDVSDATYVIDKTCTISDAEAGQCTVSLTTSDTNLDTGTYYAYVVDATGTTYETMLKSVWVVTQ